MNFSLKKGYKPWENRTDTKERNDRARKAYEALLTVTVRPPPDSGEYNSFDAMVKEKAIAKFNFSYGDEPVNPFVTAFYDAVILYAIALNETLEAGYNITNGTEITKRMRGKTFQGKDKEETCHLSFHLCLRARLISGHSPTLQSDPTHAHLISLCLGGRVCLS